MAQAERETCGRGMRQHATLQPRALPMIGVRRGRAKARWHDVLQDTMTCEVALDIALRHQAQLRDTTWPWRVGPALRRWAG